MLLLRASSQHAGLDVDLTAILGEGDGGIPEGALLGRFAEAVIGDDAARLAEIRAGLNDALGPAALVDSAAIAATFNAIDRVADSTGIPIDEARLAPTADFRQQLGIDDFPSRSDG